MRKTLLLLCAALILGTACADRERKNPLDPRNPKSRTTRTVLAELFTTDSLVYYTSTAVSPETSWTDSIAIGTPETLAADVPGTTFILIDSLLNGILQASGALTVPHALDTVNANINDSLRKTWHHNTAVVRNDTLQHYEPVESLVTAAYDADNVITAEYHLADGYAFPAAETLYTAYQAGAATPAGRYAAVYLNGTGDPVDMGDTAAAAAVHALALNTALAPLTGRTGYYILEGELAVVNTEIDSATTHTTLTGSGRLARLGSVDGDSVIVRYVFTRHLNAAHPFLVVGTSENAFRITAPEAGETYTLPSRSITVESAIGAGYANVIVVLADAATGEVLQAVLND